MAGVLICRHRGDSRLSIRLRVICRQMDGPTVAWEPPAGDRSHPAL